MENEEFYGYAGKILRADLTGGRISSEGLDEAILRKYIGGVSLGAKFLWCWGSSLPSAIMTPSTMRSLRPIRDRCGTI